MTLNGRCSVKIFSCQPSLPLTRLATALCPLYRYKYRRTIDLNNREPLTVERFERTGG